MSYTNAEHLTDPRGEEIGRLWSTIYSWISHRMSITAEDKIRVATELTRAIMAEQQHPPVCCPLPEGHA